MSKTVIRNVTVVLLDRLAEGSAVVLDQGKIQSVVSDAELGDIQADEIIDGGGKYLAPGLIDLHIHGTCSLQVDASVEEFTGLCRELPKFGVTGWLPTVMVKPKGQDAEYLAQLAATQAPGAAVLGFHMEGPFLTLTGAIPPDSLGSADVDRVKALIEAARPYKAIFSVAPDFDGVMELIQVMAKDNTPVFMTHTGASVEQTRDAIEAGVRHATHFYDVFPEPDETDAGVRPAGAVEAVLADPRVSVDFILDGEHVHPVVVEMALQCKGPDRVCLITDASSGAGMPPGKYKFANDDVVFAYEGGPARLSPDSRLPGGLAGSGLTMDRAVRNAIKMLKVDLPTAIRMASTNPAQTLRINDYKGQVAQGYDADLILLDKDLNVTQTFVGGETVYRADA